MFHKEILPGFFFFFFLKCCLKPCFTTALFSLTTRAGCQRAHLRLLYVLLHLLRTGGVSFKFIVLFPVRYMYYLSRHLPSSEMFHEEKRNAVSCVRRRGRTRHVIWTARRCKSHFCPVFPHKSYHPWQPISLPTVSKEPFSHSSVITAYSQAIMCTACVCGSICVFFCPLFQPVMNLISRPSSLSNKSSSGCIKMIDGRGS